MPRTVTVSFEDGGQHVYNNVPDNITPDAIEQRAATEFSGKKLTGIDGGKTSAHRSRVNEIPNDYAPVPESKPPSVLDRIKGAGEAVLSLLTGATGGAAGMIGGTLGGVAGAIDTAIRGGTQPRGGLNDAAMDQAQRFTYGPRTASGQEQSQGLASLLQPLAALPPAAGGAAALTGPALTQVRAAAPAALRAAIPTTEINALRAPFSREEPQMVGAGSAMTNAATLRNERAQALPVPIDLTKGQRERTFDQQRFERETAKIPKAGEPLRQRFAEQNEKILQNFDAWLDETGAQSPDLRATGQIVDKVLTEKAAKAKAAINAEYEKARSSGELASPVDVTAIYEQLERRKPQSINAGVIGATKGEIDALAGPQRKDVFGQPIPRTISINDLEEIRKSVTASRGKDATNAHFAKEIIGLIDAATDGAGGDSYKRARFLRTKYGREFENVGVVDKLMSTKPGTADRAVAYEDVFNHSIIGGSLDDTRMIRKTLQTAGPQGEQAWRELQGQTINYLKDASSKNAQRDIRGNPVVSFAGLDKAVRSLDADGKLDFIFGQQGSQRIRDLRDISADVVTTPPGAVNTSNTASVVMAALDAVGMFHGIPAPVATATHQAAKALQARKINKQVGQALAPLASPIVQQPSGLARLLQSR